MSTFDVARVAYDAALATWDDPEVPSEGLTARTCGRPGCTKPHIARGLCKAHYSEAGRRAAGIKPRRTSDTCTYPGCDRPFYSRDLCAAHYNQRQRGVELHPVTGTAPPPRKRGNLPAGWDRTEPKRAASQLGTGFTREVGPVQPLDDKTLSLAARRLKRWGAEDLADVLGIEVDA